MRQTGPALSFLGMDATQVWDVLRRELDVIHGEYLASGRGQEFDHCVARLRADHRWPFDAHS